MLDSLPPAGSTAGILGGALVAIYGIWRKLKSDSGSDKIDAKSQQLIDNMEEQLKRETEEKIRLSAVIERLAAERNEAVEKMGKLEATVQLLGDRVKEMKLEIEGLEKENRQLRENVQELIGKVVLFLKDKE